MASHTSSFDISELIDKELEWTDLDSFTKECLYLRKVIDDGKTKKVFCLPITRKDLSTLKDAIQSAFGKNTWQ